MIATPLPTVSGSKGTKPTLTFPDAEAPADLEIQVLDAGDGQIVEPGDTIVCNYLGQIWDGQVFDNSFDRGQPLSFQIGVGMVYPWLGRGPGRPARGFARAAVHPLRARLRLPWRASGRH